VTALVLCARDGSRLALDPERWHAPATTADGALLDRVEGPVLDIGCGPGRALERLARRGIPALGVDPAPAAVRIARQRGCAVLERSVFAPLPGEGRWSTALLLDGNIGIGGDPVRLLRRCRRLVRPSGCVAVEVEPAGTGWRSCVARLERGHHRGAWFPWAVVGEDAIEELAAPAGLRVVARYGDERSFVLLRC
jgi:SAM-dependent methyltransferase